MTEDKETVYKKGMSTTKMDIQAIRTKDEKYKVSIINGKIVRTYDGEIVG